MEASPESSAQTTVTLVLRDGEMPKPVYIVCSLSGAEDKATGLISLYHVLETIHVIRQHPDQKHDLSTTI